MRRSQVDARIDAAIRLLDDLGIALPPQARWDLPTWRSHAAQAGELARRGIGWDLTDFGSGDVDRVGLLCYTLSNGVLDQAGRPIDQPYANKLLIVGEGQLTPTHHHWRKCEDIVVLAGGNLQVRLFAVGPADSVDRIADVRVLLDNTWTTRRPGDVVTLGPGQRLRLDPHHYHEFQGEPGTGTVVAEEVSMVNDDAGDNCFPPGEDRGRFPAIEEDRAPRRLLCTELPGTEAFERLVARHPEAAGNAQPRARNDP